MQGPAAVHRVRTLVGYGVLGRFVEVAGVIKQTFRTKEETSHRLGVPHDAKRLRQLRVRVGGLISRFATTSLGMKAYGFG